MFSVYIVVALQSKALCTTKILVAKETIELIASTSSSVLVSVGESGGGESVVPIVIKKHHGLFGKKNCLLASLTAIVFI